MFDIRDNNNNKEKDFQEYKDNYECVENNNNFILDEKQFDVNKNAENVSGDFDNSFLCVEDIKEDKTNAPQKLSWWQKIKILYLNKDFVAVSLYGISFYATYVSWFMFALFALGRFSHVDVLMIIGVLGSMLSIFASVVGDEIAGKLSGGGRKIYGVIIIIGAIILFGCGIYGIVLNDDEYITGGVLGLFALSFIPWLLDGAGIPRDKQVYVERHYSSSSLGSGYNAIAEVFGIPQPKELPAIEVTRDKDLDDELEKYLAKGISIPDVKISNISEMTMLSAQNEDSENIESNDEL